MTRGYEILLEQRIVETLSVYIRSLPSGILKKFDERIDGNDALARYCEVIDKKTVEIVRITAQEIGIYTNLYNVHTNQSADEYKLIYYVGIAVERHLKAEGLDNVAKAHMYVMIGLLEYRLRTLGIDKTNMSKALLGLIDVNRFHEQLGKSGCYMLHKCISTLEIENPTS